MEIIIQRESSLDPNEFKDVLIRSTLGERRPIENMNRIRLMCEQANLIVSARHNGRLIGIARSISDFTFATYLSDLAVDEAYQKQGIGKKLIAFTQAEAPEATLILLAAPKAISYYPKIGMEQYEYCFLLKPNESLQ